MQATLNGVLTFGDGELCDCWFEWGGSTLYGMSTPKHYGLLAGATFNDTIYNLSEGTMYHFRACAQNSIGISYGQDMIFVTESFAGPTVLLTDDQLLLLLGV